MIKGARWANCGRVELPKTTACRKLSTNEGLPCTSIFGVTERTGDENAEVSSKDDKRLSFPM